jgi:hypothetical protein
VRVEIDERALNKIGHVDGDEESFGHKHKNVERPTRLRKLRRGGRSMSNLESVALQRFPSCLDV